MKTLLILIAGLVFAAPSPTTAAAGAADAAGAKDPIVPVIEGEWWRIAGNPDLGKYTNDKQEPVDFGIWQAADGTWQVWSCIRNTNCGGHSRLFYGWEGKSITDKDWTPKGIKMEADPKLGEAEGGLQAPCVVRADGKFWMAYGAWVHIWFATSADGKTFERVIQPNGKTGAFSEGPRSNTRDPMLIKISDLWHCYYTAIVGERGYGYCRTSPDLKHWSHSFITSYGGSVGSNPWWNECPHVVEVEPGEFVYFRNQFYGKGARNWAYYSTNPYNFGIDNDSCLVADLPIAAPEIVMHEGKYYIVALTPDLDGIRVARLRWGRVSKFGAPVFDFDNEAIRKQWKMIKGNFEAIFWDKTHQPFGAPSRFVIGTCETKKGAYDDTRTGVIESPAFMLEDETYTLLMGGGRDEKTEYVSIVDADSGAEITRFAGGDRNEVEPMRFRPAQNAGKRVRIRVVDEATGGWGHINFGGIYRQGKPVLFK